MDQIQIFISYAREDQAKAREIYRRLHDAGYKPWLDEEDLLPGQNFRLVIERSLTGSDFVIICLSRTSVAKRSFFQREIKHALDKLKEMLPEDIFVIPARIDECEMPEELKDRHWVDLFDERGWEKLFRALDYELRKRGKTPPKLLETSPPLTSPESEARRTKAPPQPRFEATDPKPAGTLPVEVQSNLLIEDLANGVKIELVKLPGGEFTMGSNDGSDDEKPPHQVKLSPFAIGTYEVTQKQWTAVLSDNPSKFKGSDDLPVENVSWDMVQTFLQRLNGKYRLPTEAEWEYAARAGSQSRYSFGDNENELRNYAWFSGNSNSQTHPVGKLKPNRFGLYDMHGNVWEWCSDWYDASYYKQGVRTNPQGPNTGSYRVDRGGGWSNDAVNCRSALRHWYAPGLRSDVLGFRLVRVGP